MTYRDYTLADLEREFEVLRSDVACTRINMTQSAVEPEVAHVEVEFHPDVTMSMMSAEILRLRMAQAVPAVPTIPLSMCNRMEILMDLGEQQVEDALQVGMPVCIDEQGRIGRHGSPLGVLMQVDRGNHQARIRIQPGSPVDTTQPPPMRVTEFNDPPPLSRDAVELARIQLERRPFILPSDPRIMRARQEIMAAEDARIFEVLDSIANHGDSAQQPRPKKPKPAPEPRPVFKTRYERIMNALKGK